MNTAWLTLVAIVFTWNAQAQSTRRLTFQSKADQFELVLTGGNGTVNGKPASLGGFKELLPLVTGDLANECEPPKGRADVTVRENGKARYIFIKAGMVSDGKNCVTVAGDGLFYFPNHRDFFIGAKTDAIPLKAPLKFFRQGVKLFELKKSSGQWVNANSVKLLNWDFMEQFENSLRSFSVRFRVLPDITHAKPNLILQSGDLAYEFFKLSNGSWAVKKPKTAWLEASDDWSFWYDLDDSVLEDRFTPQIRLIEDSTKDKAERLAALQKLNDSWSPNLRDLYHKVVLDKSATPEMKDIAIKRLKSKPSLETSQVMAQVLSESHDEDFKVLASQILRISYPKGPLYNPDAPPAERAKVIEYWNQWYASHKSAP